MKIKTGEDVILDTCPECGSYDINTWEEPRESKSQIVSVSNVRWVYIVSECIECGYSDKVASEKAGIKDESPKYF